MRREASGKNGVATLRLPSVAFGLSLLLVGAALPPDLARADGEAVAAGTLGKDPRASVALGGLKRGLKALGLKVRPPREVAKAAGAPLSALASACAGRAACYDGIAKSVSSEVWLVDVVRGNYVSQVVIHRGRPGASGKSAQLTFFSDDEVGPAAYGLALELGGLTAEGTVTVTSEPAGADVRIAGQLVGQTPVLGFKAPAGALRVDIEAKGFEDLSRLVALEPGGAATVAHTLKVKLDEIPLADLDDDFEEPEAVASTGTGETVTTGGGTEGSLSPEEAARVALPPLTATTVAPTGRRGPRLPTWFAAGLGVLAMGGGAYFGLDAGAQARSAQSAPVQLDVQAFNDDARSSAMKANLLYGVGAVALGTATYLLIRDLSR